MLSTRSASLLSLLLLLFMSPFAAAQGGYAKEKFPQHGLRFELARDYKWLAIQPSEQWVVLNWENSRSAKGSRLSVIRIDHVSEGGPVTPGERRLDPEVPKPKPAEAGVKKEQDKKEKLLPINSWGRYLEQVHKDWEATEVATGKPRDDYEATEYLVTQKKNRKWKGWAYVWQKHATRSFIVVGWAQPKDYDDQVKIWRRVAERMRFDEPIIDPKIEKLRKYYAKRPKFKDPEYRIRVQSRLEGNWKSEDTENYLVIYNTKDQPLVRRIVKDMESIRKEYMRLFPPAEEINAVSTVRVCKDRTEYLKYGGPQGSAGYWSWMSEELVFYDATKREKGKKTEKVDTFIVLYHEAFHQFIHYSVGRLAPHTWFNEGYGDYFSGALVRGGKVKKIGVNTWRIRTIQEAIKTHRFTHLREIVEWSKSRYYGTRHAYAQGWSMVYFLNESKEAKRHPVWSKILTTYFDTMKAEWAKEKLAILDDDDESAMRAVTMVAQEKVRERARQVAFENVNFDEMEDAWIRFIMAIKVK